MNKVRETVVSIAAPVDKNVIWVDISGEQPIQKVFLNGDWQNLSGGSVPTNVMTKVADPHNGNILTTDASGQAVDSGHDVSDFLATPSTTGQEGEVLSVDNDGNPVWTTITPTGTADTEMSDSSTNAVQNKVIKEYVDSNFARQDGYYSQMSVGLSENMISPDGVTDNAPYIFRTSAGDTSIGTGYATLQKMEGHTEKFNQLVQNGNFSDGTTGWFERYDGTLTVTNGIAKLSAPSEGAYPTANTNTNFTIGHKYFIECFVKNIHGNTFLTFGSFNGISLTHGVQASIGYNKSIITVSNSSNRFGAYFIKTSNDDYAEFSYLNCIDLTAMFGTDAEIAAALGIDVADITTSTGVAAFEAWLTKNVGYQDYYPYTDGKLVSVNVDGLKTVGFNQWDEQWELGNIDDSGVNDDTIQYRIRSKNYIPCFPDTEYYFDWENPLTNAIRLFFYDSSKTFISYNQYPPNNTFTTPENCRYIRFRSAGSNNVTTYNNDICINLSWSGYRNGEYEPYWTETLDLEWIKSLKDTNDNQLFPYGLLSAGSVRDEVTATKAIKRVGAVDLGSLTWNYISVLSGREYFSATLPQDGVFYSGTEIPNAICSKLQVTSGTILSGHSIDMCITLSNSTFNTSTELKAVYAYASNYTDAATFKTAMNGVMLYYELATPIEIDITPAENMNYKVDDFGTEEFVSSALTTPQTAAPYQTTHYMDNLRDKLRNIDNNFVSATQAQSFTDAQKAQARHNIGAGTVNPTDNCPQLTAGTAKNLIDTHGVGSEQEFVFRETGGGIAISGNGNVTIQKFKGKTLKWNQVAPLFSITTGSAERWSIEQCTSSISSDGRQVDITFTTATNLRFRLYQNVISGHKYYVQCSSMRSAGCPVTGYGSSGFMDTRIITSAGVGNFSQISYIIQSSDTSYNSVLYPPAENHENETFSVKDFVCIDLTLMFGAGNEPSTVEEFEALYPLDYYPYTATPVLINNEVKQIETTGRNQWDEEWVTYESTRIKNKNLIRLIKGATYYFKANFTGYMYMSWFNLDGTYAGSNAMAPNQTFEAITDYLDFYTPVGTGGTYQNDICINISDASFNGTYEAYHKNTIDINLDNFQVKDGENNVITVNGLKSAGSVYDEIDPVRKKYIKRIGVVDLGDLGWVYTQGANNTRFFKSSVLNDAKGGWSATQNRICSNYGSSCSSDDIYTGSCDKEIIIDGDNRVRLRDTSMSSTDIDAQGKISILSGVPLYYELATPVEYDLVTTIPDVYATPAGGTEGIVPQGVNASGVPKTTPFRGTNLYSKDYVQTINDMPVDYDTTASIDALTTALATTLGTALNGTFTITRGNFDDLNKKYSWSVGFTANT